MGLRLGDDVALDRGKKLDIAIDIKGFSVFRSFLGMFGLDFHFFFFFFAFHSVLFLIDAVNKGKGVIGWLVGWWWWWLCVHIEGGTMKLINKKK